MKFIDKAVADVAAQPFMPIRLERVVRKQLLYLLGTVVLLFAASQTEGALAAGLALWGGFRVLGYFVIGLAGRAHRKRLARLDALPPQWLAFLRGGEKPHGSVRVKITGDARGFRDATARAAKAAEEMRP